MKTSRTSVPDLAALRIYWDTRPCNIRHSPATVGTRTYFDQVEARKYFVEPHIPRFADFARWKGKKVLEIGCGIGTDAVNFAKAGAEYVAIELSKRSLELTRKRFKVFGLKGRFYLGNAEDLAAVIPRQTFDLIYSFGVIHHTPFPEKAVAAVRTFMDVRSEFRLMLYASNSWKNIMIEAGYDRPEAQAGCPLARTYTPESLHALLKGFRIVSLRQEHIFPYIPEKYVKYEYERQPWFKAMPPRMFHALEKRLGWHLCIVARRADAR